MDLKEKKKAQLLKQGPVLKKTGFSKNLLNWYQENKESHPWRTFWLKHKSPYHVWVSEIMLQQTLIKVVIPLYLKFFKKFPKIQDLANAESKELQQAVKGLGYYNRFDRLHKAAQYLCEKKLPVEWPDSYEAWKKIPGVGEYTASALSSICLDEVKAVVDGNVERVLSRLFLIREEINTYSMKKILGELSQTLILEESPGDYNQGIMELGQKICLKSKPLCSSCPVSSYCLAYKKKATDSVPVVLKNKKSVEINITALIAVKKGKVFLTKRGEKSRFLKNRVGFPLLEIKKTGPSLGSFSHSITHHKIRVRVVKSSAQGLPKNLEGIWVEKSELENNLMSSLDSKILNCFQPF